ncbi:hypothetical protein [Levilactobacillus acidifarinae]|uniref:hypothetical protein n=1 Tax=Levilactobacillus acidifarinae TaxID=267364 RepID=UPI00070B1161|nr:hypothetical protein [Levilactobacillus acidifarinae]GEO70556.1 hypothetical protein LAC03_24660 [Levilactobacillus acidifarinae]
MVERISNVLLASVWLAMVLILLVYSGEYNNGAPIETALVIYVLMIHYSLRGVELSFKWVPVALILYIMGGILGGITSQGFQNALVLGIMVTMTILVEAISYDVLWAVIAKVRNA